MIEELAPFSGAETSCPKCRNQQASTRHQPARGAVGYAGGRSVLEHLARCCGRCGHQWREALPTGGAR